MKGNQRQKKLHEWISFSFVTGTKDATPKAARKKATPKATMKKRKDSSISIPPRPDPSFARA